MRFPPLAGWLTGRFASRVVPIVALWFSAVPCQAQVADCQATISLSVTGPDDHALVGWTAQYEFGFTGGPTQLVWYLDGKAGGAAIPALGPQTWSGSVDASCLPNGSHSIRVEARSCGNVASDTKSFTVQHHPTVSAVVTELDAATVNLHVTYNFPQASGTVSVEWAQSKSGGRAFIDSFGASGSGEWDHVLPRQEKNEAVVITASSACGTESETAVAMVPAVDRSCKIESPKCQNCVGAPVRLANGNMRYTDAEPLPSTVAPDTRRTYDSSVADSGAFGIGWTSMFDAWLRVAGDLVVIGTEENDRVVFRMIGGAYHQVWPTGVERRGTLNLFDGGNYEYREGGSDLLRFYHPGDGRLVGIRRLSAATGITITYGDGGAPQTVADNNGTWQRTITLDSNGRVQTIGVAGRPDIVWSYTYDASGRLILVTAPDGHQWRRYEYTGGRMSAAYDNADRTIETHAFDASGKAGTSVAATDSITDVEYGIAGRVAGETITQVTSATGRVAKYYQRYIAGRPVTVQVDGGCASCGTGDVVFAFDSAGRVIREQDARGYITVRTYGYGPSIVSSSGRWRPAACDPATDPGHCRVTPDELLTLTLTATTATRTTSYTYDNGTWRDRPTMITTTSVVAGAPARTQTLTYEGVTGLVVSDTTTGSTSSATTQETHTVTTSLYGGDGAAFAPGGAFDSAWLSLPQPNRFRRTVDGPRMDVSDVTTFVYYPIDASVPSTWRGRLAAVRNAAGQITRYENYDVFGNPGRVVDPNGVATESTFDAAGRLLTSTITGVSGCDTTADPLCATGITSSLSYEAGMGRLVSTTQPRGGTTSYEYDGYGRTAALTRSIAAGAYERIEYDYDAGAPNGSIVTSYGYDINGNLTSVTDPNGNVTSYVYDDFGRMLRQTSPVTGVTTYTYDLGGNLTSTTDANGATTTRMYDALGRVTNATSTRGGSSEVVTWTYDAGSFGIGRVRTMTDPEGSTTYSYERRGLLTSEARTMGGSTYTFGYGYDADGDRSSVAYQTGGTVDYTFDLAGRPSSATIRGATTIVSGAAYLPFGPLTALTYGNGTVKTMQYDSRYRVAENRLTVGGTTLADYTYAEDDAGNITVIHDGVDASYDRSFAYDDLNRLTAAQTGTSLWQDGAFTYDAMGNMTSRTLGRAPVDDGTILSVGRRVAKAVNGVVDRTTFAYSGTTPKLSVVTANGLDHPMSYDAAGNETQYYVTRTYSPRNFLTSVSDPSTEGVPHVVQYGYDGRGVRVRRSESPVPAGTAKRYSFYTPELQLLVTTVDDADNPWSNGSSSTALPLAMNRAIIWFGSLPVAEYGPPRTAPPTSVLSLPRSRRRANSAAATALFYTFTDHLGTPILQTDATAAIVWRVEYEPYGTVWTTRAGAPADQPLRFPGQEYESNWDGTDESYNIFRWYSAGWGRYSQADPLTFDRAYAPFGFAGANPLTVSDPLGLYSVYDNTVWQGIPEKQAFYNACITTIQDKMKGRMPAGACNNTAASLTCGCSCRDGVVGIDPIDVFIVGNVYFFSGDWSQMRKANDTSVVDARSAVHHEWFEHIFPALRSVDPLITNVEGSTFDSASDCNAACSALRQKVSVAFKHALVETQRAEERKYYK